MGEVSGLLGAFVAGMITIVVVGCWALRMIARDWIVGPRHPRRRWGER